METASDLAADSSAETTRPVLYVAAPGGEALELNAAWLAHDRYDEFAGLLPLGNDLCSEGSCDAARGDFDNSWARGQCRFVNGGNDGGDEGDTGGVGGAGGDGDDGGLPTPVMPPPSPPPSSPPSSSPPPSSPPSTPPIALNRPVPTTESNDSSAVGNHDRDDDAAAAAAASLHRKGMIEVG